MNETSKVSLLWPNEEIKEEYKDLISISNRTAADLGMEQIAQGISINSKYEGDCMRILRQLCNDEETIHYRLDIVDDFVRNPNLSAQMESILPQLRKLDSLNDKKSIIGAEPLRMIAWQTETLGLYIDIAAALKEILDSFQDVIHSEGLKRLHLFLIKLTNGETYQSMLSEIPQIREKLQSMSSITLGINLDEEFKPTEAIFLSAESKNVKKKRSFISSILGLNSADEPFEGISQYKSIIKINHAPLEKVLLRCLEEIFHETLKPVSESLQKYIQINTRVLTDLEFEIAFFVGASRFIQRLTANGLKLCKPQAMPKDDRSFVIKQLTDVWLAQKFVHQLSEVDLERIIVDNDVYFGPDARIFILTGPNQGGKTTYTRAIGLAQVLFQAGMFVPGVQARISPVDWIFTHFSEEETPNADHGRLGEESKKLAEIFHKATPHSLLLLNESLSSTSPRDSYYLARELVKGMKLIGCRAVFTTHILDLAADADQINQELPTEDQIVSMTAGIDENESAGNASEKDAAKRTYKVVPGPPRGMSFAKDIARKHGLSLEQMIETLRQRQIIDFHIDTEKISHDM